MELVRPEMEHLPSYLAALNRGWSADNTRGMAAVQEQLDAIGHDASSFVAFQTDREAAGPVITLPDGSKVPRIPGFLMWMWDGEFCGSIGFRWQPGTEALPPYVLGHIGYAVVPWKQRRGYATKALGLILAHPRKEGLAHVDLTTDEDNHASQKVMRANGAIFVERFRKVAAQGGGETLRFRIPLAS
ncbi:MAG TPA: GNAT family N-acetyltransferase [Usitatibacter sp.]